MATDKRFLATNKLPNSNAYKQVFSSKKRSVDKFFLVIVKENSENIARLGLVISKKKIRKAFFRNRIKRLIRESFRLNKTRLIGNDIVVVAKKKLISLDMVSLKEEINKHWECFAK